MTDNDIVRFALMPKFSQKQADYVIATESFSPIKEECDVVNQLLDKVHVLSDAHTKLLKYGITPFIEEEYSDVLSAYSVNFKTQSVHACIEGLSSIIERVWTSIKNALMRIFQYLSENPIFTMWFNRCEFYRVRMSNMIAGPLRAYIKADIDKFGTIVATGWNLQEFKMRAYHLGNLISKIKNNMNARFEMLDVYHVFGAEIQGLGCGFVDGNVMPVPPATTRTTAKEFEWKPFDVYQIASNLYSKVAVNSMYLTRLNTELGRSLKIAITEADNVLSGRSDGSNEEQIALSKNRVKNIKNMLMLVQIAVNNLCLMCAQWYKYASSFENL